jgi:hypothetical protein
MPPQVSLEHELPHQAGAAGRGDNLVAISIVHTRTGWRSAPWRTNSQAPYKGNSATSDGELAWFNLRIGHSV